MAFKDICSKIINSNIENAEAWLEHALKDGLDINYQYQPDEHDGNGTMLYWATRDGNDIIVDLLLKNGAARGINISGDRGYTALIHAAEKGYKEIVMLLLFYKADKTMRDDIFGFTSLHHAVRKDHASIVQLLLDDGIDIDILSNSGDTPLHSAVRCDSKEIVLLLLNRGAKVNIKYSISQTSPLHLAAQKKSITKLLIQHGAEIDAQNKDGETALSLASTNSAIVVMKLLLKHGANPNVRDKYMTTSIHWQAWGGYLLAVKILLKNGANPNLADIEGKSALHYAIQCLIQFHHRNAAAIIFALMKSGSNVYKLDEKGKTFWSTLPDHETKTIINTLYFQHVRMTWGLPKTWKPPVVQTFFQLAHIAPNTMLFIKQSRNIEKGLFFLPKLQDKHNLLLQSSCSETDLIISSINYYLPKELRDIIQFHLLVCLLQKNSLVTMLLESTKREETLKHLSMIVTFLTAPEGSKTQDNVITYLSRLKK
jgi:ankyrin repeat protein